MSVQKKEQNDFDEVTVVDEKKSIRMLNNDLTSFDAAIDTMMKCFKKTIEEAGDLAYKIHTNGSAIVYTNSEDDCKKVLEKTKKFCLDKKDEPGYYHLLKFVITDC